LSGQTHLPTDTLLL
jgi:hypothetical protein